MKPADATLLALLRRVLFFSADVLDEFSPGMDWAAVFIEAIHQTVLPLAMEAALTLPEDIRPSEQQLEPFRNYATSQAVKNERLMAEQNKLLKAFAERSIPCVVLKGSSAAAPYPRPELRVLGDIDLLVDRTSLESAAEILLELDYRKGKGNEVIHFGFAGAFAYVELHFETTSFPDNTAGRALRILMASALPAQRTVTQGDYTFPVLSPEQQAVSLLMHMQRHMKALGIGLRHLCDFAVFIKQLSPGEWERTVAPALKEGSLLRFAQFLARTCVLYLGLPPASAPWCGGVSDSVCRELILEFLRSGNFGCKDPRHRASSVLGLDKTGLGTSRFMTMTILRNMNLYARKHYPSTEHLPLLLPVFWVFLPLKHLFDTRKSAARPEVMRTFSEGRRRQRLFAQLGLFEEGYRAKGWNRHCDR